jgi:hypothetical protein
VPVWPPTRTPTACSTCSGGYDDDGRVPNASLDTVLVQEERPRVRGEGQAAGGAGQEAACAQIDQERHDQTRRPAEGPAPNMSRPLLHPSGPDHGVAPPVPGVTRARWPKHRWTPNQARKRRRRFQGLLFNHEAAASVSSLTIRSQSCGVSGGAAVRADGNRHQPDLSRRVRPGPVSSMYSVLGPAPVTERNHRPFQSVGMPVRMSLSFTAVGA